MKKGFTDWLHQASPDIICLQEIKAMENQVAVEAIEKAGYPFDIGSAPKKKAIVV